MAITKWTNLLLPRLPGASEALVNAETIQVIDNFCRESTAWRDMLYGFDISQNDRDVPITIGDGSQRVVVGILRVYFDQRQLTQYSHVPFESTSSYPSGWSTKPSDPSIVSLSAIPNKEHLGNLDAYVYQAPVDPVNITDDMTLLTEDFFEFIFDGILGRFMSMPQKPYSDQRLATYHLSRYRDGVRKARSMANRGFTGNAQNWVFPTFGR
jgi:hypothetical protein